MRRFRAGISAKPTRGKKDGRPNPQEFGGLFFARLYFCNRVAINFASCADPSNLPILIEYRRLTGSYAKWVFLADATGRGSVRNSIKMGSPGIPTAGATFGSAGGSRRNGVAYAMSVYFAGGFL